MCSLAVDSCYYIVVSIVLTKVKKFLLSCSIFRNSEGRQMAVLAKESPGEFDRGGKGIQDNRKIKKNPTILSKPKTDLLAHFQALISEI